MFYFYILRCKDNSLYCGMTPDLKKREQAHNAGRGSAYVHSRGGGKIIYSEAFDIKNKALQREAEVKRWPKTKKEALVSSRST